MAQTAPPLYDLMAIGFARLEFVKRSVGKNACAKSAYNLRGRIFFEGHAYRSAQTFDWSLKPKPVFHEVLLPTGVDLRFKDPEILWNAVEQMEKRRDSQVALEMVLALPDDQAISGEDKIYLATSFVNEHFVKNGLAAQIDIHPPDRTVRTENGKAAVVDHNWHAHVVITTRRFHRDGHGLQSHKARDLMPTMRGGQVISGPDWGKLWTEHQNRFFVSKGLALRVDSNAIVAQRHLGPVRMRGRAMAMLEEHYLRTELNTLECRDPAKVLEKLTETNSSFDRYDVERFAAKFIPASDRSKVLKAFWQQQSLVQLFGRETRAPVGRYSSVQALTEEQQAYRLAGRLQRKSPFPLRQGPLYDQLSREQQAAFSKIVLGKRLGCIEGHAGTGKSYLLAALCEGYSQQGYRVRVFGPDNATIAALREKGLDKGENAYRFLFAHYHGRRQIRSGREVWLVDEAGKLGTRPMLELLRAAEKHDVQVILSGCSQQLSSVERGGLFGAFCQRYGAAVLEDVQRQKEQAQREIALNLAKGEVGLAIDQLHRGGGIRWGANREEAIEYLITSWAQARVDHPKDSVALIAHSNAEVRVLNEMVHRWRQTRGEISEKEYRCQTMHGQIYVSVGDQIEFRKKDHGLNVTNGQTGVLVEASTKQFIVALNESGGRRQVAFDPTEYNSFQLGYAMTYYRSQGKTVDRAYVLHSPQMSKPMFYVGLTRHVKRATLFVARDQVSCVQDLKRQLFNSPKEPLLSDFANSIDLSVQKKLRDQKEQIGVLKGSGSMFDRVKGHGLQALDRLKTKTRPLIEKYQDRRPDREFYRLTESPSSEKGFVAEVVAEKSLMLPTDPDPVDLDLATIASNLPTQARSTPKSHVLSPAERSPRQQAWRQLSEHNRELIKTYYGACDEAATLRELHQASGKNKQRWMHACAQRNAAAYLVTTALSAKEMKGVFSKTSLEIVQDRSVRHLASQQRVSLDSVQEKLAERLDSLLFRLFPDGPSWQDSHGLRFGSKGSLSVVYRGSNKGTFFDFEQGTGGGPLQLIQRELGFSQQDAQEWARDFLGEPSQVQVSQTFNFNRSQQQREGRWTAIQPNQEAPKLEVMSRGLNNHYREDGRYTYCNREGQLLFYTLRLVARGDPSQKIVLPLSFGYSDRSGEEPHWRLKAYAAHHRPLYKQELLDQHPHARVLIVEGEKTVDASGKLFPADKTICLSWSGGASAVDKTDWSSLQDREVVIWPDSDSAGFEAAEKICECLRRVGTKSLNVVSRDQLDRAFPEKWDLADPLPAGKTMDNIRDMLLRAEEKAVDVGLVLAGHNTKELSQKEHMQWKQQAQDVLWRVDERLRKSLEAKHGQRSWEIRDAIVGEAQRVLSHQADLCFQLEKECDSADSARKIAFRAVMS